jgi:predicted nucleic acid-binding protein
LHAAARSYLLSLISSGDIFVPTIVLTEYDLELKTHGISSPDRERILRDLGILIPNNKMLPCTPLIHAMAVNLESFGGYFDSVIAATAKAYSATIVSTDTIFDAIGIPRTW